MLEAIHFAMFALLPLMMFAAAYGLRDILRSLKAVTPDLPEPAEITYKPLKNNNFALAA